MVYKILYYLVNILLRIYYRKVYVNGTEKIPKNKPVFLVSNHPNGFMEPIIMACTFPVELHFLVRGDLFENKALRPLLLSTNQIPIYRFRDGFASLRNNQKTIIKTTEVLNGNNAVLIFAEGSTNGDWNLRPLKKGMARMAFQCLDQNQDLDLHIVPVGVTFSQSHIPGTEVIINVGDPFPVKDYYIKNAAVAKEKMDEMTAKCHAEMEKLILHLESKEDENIIRQKWQDINNPRKTSFLPRVCKTGISVFTELKNCCNQLNAKSAIQVADSSKKSPILGQRFDKSFLLFAPLAFIGYLLWLLPLSLGKMITKKYVKQREFISSVEISSKGAFCLIYLILIKIIGFLLFGFLNTVLLLLVMVITGIFYLYYNEKRRMVNQYIFQ